MGMCLAARETPSDWVCDMEGIAAVFTKRFKLKEGEMGGTPQGLRTDLPSNVRGVTANLRHERVEKSLGRALRLLLTACLWLSIAACKATVLAGVDPEAKLSPPQSFSGNPVVLRSSCSERGGCIIASVGALRPTRMTCTKASGSNPGNYPPACYVTCNPSCGAATLRPGASGATSGPGTISLNCNGQYPLACELSVEAP